MKYESQCRLIDVGAKPCQDWVPIPGFDGYEASRMGLIRNARGKNINQRLAGNGALQVHIGRATAMVHNLVLRAFSGHPLGRGYRPKHANGDKSDNRYDNLMWAGKPQ